MCMLKDASRLIVFCYVLSAHEIEVFFTGGRKNAN